MKTKEQLLAKYKEYYMDMLVLADMKEVFIPHSFPLAKQMADMILNEVGDLYKVEKVEFEVSGYNWVDSEKLVEIESEAHGKFEIYGSTGYVVTLKQ